MLRHAYGKTGRTAEHLRCTSLALSLPRRGGAGTAAVLSEGGEDPRGGGRLAGGLWGKRTEAGELAARQSISQAVVPSRYMLKSNGIISPCCMHEEPAKEGQQGWMPGRFPLPSLHNGQVIAVESDPQASPEMSPGEGSREDCKQLLPLNGDGPGEALVRLPRVVEPSAVKVCPTAECPGGICVEVEVVGRDAVGVDEACSTIPGW